jgi:osmotically-inducible protein OsmY
MAMKVSQVFGAAGLAVLLFVPLSINPASAQTSSAAIQLDDETIESNVEKALEKDAVLAPRDIDVESKNGVVTLTGKVRTAADKERAGSVARVTGVNRVVNEIKVDPNIDHSKTDAAADKTKAGLDKAVDATATAGKKTADATKKGVSETEKGLGKAADKTGDALDKSGNKMTDASITTHVKTGFSKEPLLNNTKVDVDTKDHIVTLRGTVGSDAAKTRAGEIAAATSGVSKVVNELAIR